MAMRRLGAGRAVVSVTTVVLVVVVALFLGGLAYFLNLLRGMGGSSGRTGGT